MALLMELISATHLRSLGSSFYLADATPHGVDTCPQACDALFMFVARMHQVYSGPGECWGQEKSIHLAAVPHSPRTQPRLLTKRTTNTTAGAQDTFAANSNSEYSVVNPLGMSIVKGLAGQRKRASTARGWGCFGNDCGREVATWCAS